VAPFFSEHGVYILSRRTKKVYVILRFSVPLRGSLLECCHDVCCGKTRMVWLPGS